MDVSLLIGCLYLNFSLIQSLKPFYVHREDGQCKHVLRIAVILSMRTGKKYLSSNQQSNVDKSVICFHFLN